MNIEAKELWRFAIVLGFALLPALGNFLGAVTAELFQANRRNLNRPLHTAVGIAYILIKWVSHAKDSKRLFLLHTYARG